MANIDPGYGGYEEDEATRRFRAMKQARLAAGGQIDDVSGAYVPNYNSPDSPPPPHVGPYGPYDPAATGFTQPKFVIGGQEVASGPGGSFVPTAEQKPQLSLSGDQLAYIQAEIERTAQKNSQQVATGGSVPVPSQTDSIPSGVTSVPTTVQVQPQPAQVGTQQPPATGPKLTPEQQAMIQDEIKKTAERNRQQQQPQQPITQVPQTPTGKGPQGPAGAGPTGAGPVGQTGPITNQQGAQPSQGAQGLQQITTALLSQIQNLQSQTSQNANPEIGAVFIRYAQQILGMLDEQEKQLRAENTQQGSQVDPATQFTISKLREALAENIKTTNENLNRRGILESGIREELEMKLRKGSASDEAMLLAQRLSKLQDDLAKGLSSIRAQRVSTLGQFGSAAAGAEVDWMRDSRRLAQDREGQALQAMMSLRGQLSGEDQFGRRLDFDARENALGRQAQFDLEGGRQAFQSQQQKAGFEFTAGQNAAQLQQQLTLKQMEIEAAKAQGDLNRASDASRQAADIAARLEIARTNEQGAASRQQQSQDFTRSENDKSRATQGFNQGISRANTDRAVADAQKFTYGPDAEKWLQQNAAAMQAAGVDLTAVMSWIKGNLPFPGGGGGRRQ